MALGSHVSVNAVLCLLTLQGYGALGRSLGIALPSRHGHWDGWDGQSKPMAVGEVRPLG
jgi:hypothetical protein